MCIRDRWKGIKATAQVKIPVYNDGYGAREGKVQPGFLTLSQRFRLPYNVFGKFSVGYFSGNRYGADAQRITSRQYHHPTQQYAIKYFLHNPSYLLECNI